MVILNGVTRWKLERYPNVNSVQKQFQFLAIGIRVKSVDDYKSGVINSQFYDLEMTEFFAGGYNN